MAKLEEQVSPSELVQIIRSGKTKTEITKEYRTSEQELAMMLLPLYRAGQLTKDEFNDFFKGLSLKAEPPEPEEDITEATPPPEESAEAPVDTRTRLARVFSRKTKSKEEEDSTAEVAVEEPAPPEEPPPAEPPEEDFLLEEEEAPAAEAEPPVEAHEDELEFEEIEEVEEIEAEEVEETEIEPELEPEEVAAAIEEPEIVEPEPDQETTVPVRTDEPHSEILGRLESIEKRLIRIEKILAAGK